MKILFVIKSDFLIIPIGIRTLYAVLTKEGHECEIIDLKMEFSYLRKILEFRPDIIAYSIDSFTSKYFEDFNNKIKRYFNFISIFGGPHCSISPEFINKAGVDIICIGEGELAFVELTNRLQNNQDISNIQNLWIKHNEVIYKNPPRHLISDLDSIPFPDFNIMTKYQGYKKFDVYHCSTSRGCPFNCPYCINHVYKRIYSDKGNYFRKRSVANVIDELKIMKSVLNPKFIYFVDEIFTLDKKWIVNFAKQYIDNINLPFQTFVRFDEIDADILRTLCDMKLSSVCVGIESGNEIIRGELLQRKISDQQIIEKTFLLKRNNIKVIGLNMLGLPDESIKNTFETLKLNVKCKIDYPQVFMFQPFNDCDLTKYSISKGYYDGKSDSFMKISGKSKILSKDKKQIERLYYLFYMAVKIPMLIEIVSFMVKLPLNLVYKLIFHLSRFYIVVFVSRTPSLISLINYYPRYILVKFQNKFAINKKF